MLRHSASLTYTWVLCDDQSGAATEAKKSEVPCSLSHVNAGVHPVSSIPQTAVTFILFRSLTD